jgi:hypothetical protein
MDRIAEYTDACLILAFGHPAIEAFFFWYDLDYLVGGTYQTQTSSWYQRLQQRLRRDWMTDLVVRTDADGQATFSAFTGTYHLRIDEAGASPAAATAALSQDLRGPQTWTVAFPVGVRAPSA